MKDEPIDFSALAAHTDSAAWSALWNATVVQTSRIVEQHRQHVSAVEYLLLWSRPAVAAALVVIATSLALITRQHSTIHISRGAAGLAEIARVWAAGGPTPSGNVLSDMVESRQP